MLIILLTASLCCCNKTEQTEQTDTRARQEARKASKLLQSGNLELAVPALEQSRQLALQAGDEKTLLDVLMSQAGCQFLLYSHREAIRLYLEALSLARKLKNPAMESIATSNIASTYLALGELEKAERILSSYPIDGSHIPVANRLDYLLLRFNSFSMVRRYKEADTVYKIALAEAESVPDSWLTAHPLIAAKGWGEAPKELRRAWVFEVMGQSLLDRGEFVLAESYLLEAFRLRSTYRDPARFREALKLAVLMNRHGDQDSALRLIEICRSLAQKGRSLAQLFATHKEEAKILFAAQRIPEAVEQLRLALKYMRAWRGEVLPSDSTYLRFESYLNAEVHHLFLSAASSSEAQLNNPSLAAEAFWVAEEARFASMRAEQFPAAQFRQRLPVAYWAKLNRYQALQSAALGNESSQAANLANLEVDLNLLELQAGLSIPHTHSDPTVAFREWQRSIPSDELVFSFYFDEAYSLAWTISSTSVQLRRIPGRAHLRKLIQDFRRQVLNPSQEGISSTGMELGRQLFGDFLYTHRTTPIWTVVLDDELSSLPLAAIPSDGKGSRFLVEDHALRILPSAIHLRALQSEEWRSHAVSFSDPVYNTADLRSKDASFTPLRAAKFDSMLQLSRLPLSAQEVELSFEACRRAGFQIQSFAGANASLSNLRAAISASPDILHLATHIVSGPEKAQQSFVALSASELFGPLDLNANRTSTRLVVLSGCNSTSGEMIPGLGVAGLSRAWLIAGASSVVATLWPTKDVPGPLFPVFYEELLANRWSSRAAAIALQQAQKRMLLRQDWYSQPAYWAAYIPLSRG